MRRSIPGEAPLWQEPEKREAIEVQLRLITPMFGGGFKSREVDPLMPIRPAAIRGHLRFWWRATAGAQYASAAELYKAETAIWGGANEKGEPVMGKVVVQVRVLDEGKEFTCCADSEGNNLPRYFVFPFAKQREQPPAQGRQDVEFILTLQFSEKLADAQRQQVINALKAWTVFGGVGARTRRGCGSLCVAEPQQSEWQFPVARRLQEEWLRALLGNATSLRSLKYPMLAGSIVVIGSLGDKYSVWRRLQSFWQDLRRRRIGSAEYRETLCQLRGDEQELSLRKPFLGMPVIFQDFREDEENAAGRQRSRSSSDDPTPFVGRIEPCGSGRMASRIILKPVALSNSQYAPMVVVLNAPDPECISVVADKESRIKSVPSSAKLSISADEIINMVVQAAEERFRSQRISL